MELLVEIESVAVLVVVLVGGEGARGLGGGDAVGVEIRLDHVDVEHDIEVFLDVQIVVEVLVDLDELLELNVPDFFFFEFLVAHNSFRVVSLPCVG